MHTGIYLKGQEREGVYADFQRIGIPEDAIHFIMSGNDDPQVETAQKVGVDMMAAGLRLIVELSYSRYGELLYLNGGNLHDRPPIEQNSLRAIPGLLTSGEHEKIQVGLSALIGLGAGYRYFQEHGYKNTI